MIHPENPHGPTIRSSQTEGAGQDCPICPLSLCPEARSALDGLLHSVALSRLRYRRPLANYGGIPTRAADGSRSRHWEYSVRPGVSPFRRESSISSPFPRSRIRAERTTAREVADPFGLARAEVDSSRCVGSHLLRGWLQAAETSPWLNPVSQDLFRCRQDIFLALFFCLSVFNFA